MIADLHLKETLISAVVSTLIVGLVLVLVGIHYLILEDHRLQGRIYPRVYVDGTDVGRLTKQEARKIFTKKYQKLDNVHLFVSYKDEAVATFSAQQLKLKRNVDDIVERAYLIGRSTHPPSRLYQRVATLFNLTFYEFQTRMEYDTSLIKDFLEIVKQRYNHPPVNALFSFENGRVTTFKPDEKGLMINTDQFYTDIENKLDELRKGPSDKYISLTDLIVEPEVTLNEANNLGIEELIGEGKSDYTHSIPTRVHNVILAASKFNGVVMPKDAIFSFNETIGDISAATGYQPAYIIKNGRTVLGDGGGVCQVSTTFFRAALNSGLPVVERNAHAYRVSYYENDSKPGLDATIFAPSVDLKVKNDTPASILIQTSVDEANNLLFFRFYGKKDTRKATVSSVTVWDVVGAPPAVYQDDPTLRRGVVRQVDFAAGGAKAKFDYKVERDGQAIFEKTFVSVYRPWAAVFQVGVAD